MATSFGAQQERRRQIDPDDLVPLVEREFFHGLAIVDASVVDEDVADPELVFDLYGDIGHGAFIGHIRDNRFSTSPGVANAGGDRVEQVSATRHESHGGTGSRQ